MIITLLMRSYWTIGILFAAVVASGCSSTGRMASGWGRDYDVPTRGVASSEKSDGSEGTERTRDPVGVRPSPTFAERSVADDEGPVPFSNLENQDQKLEFVLRHELTPWLGVPHVLGGTSLRGVDCSGLVQRIFSDAFNIRTPRTTAGLQRTGDKVSSRELRAGDLVFFRPGGDYTHVGIYLSDNDFIHASSSSGVMISNLTEPYWRRRYTTSRRIIKSDSDREIALSYGIRNMQGLPESE